MIYLLDTNVVCEATSKRPDLKVLEWSRAHSDESCISCVTIGEIWKGINLLPDGKRKQGLQSWADGLDQEFSHRILCLDQEILKTWGAYYAYHEARGSNLGIFDSLIAATALVHGLVVATRNTADFPKEIKTMDPWSS